MLGQVTRTQSVIYNIFEWAAKGQSPLVVVGISNTMDLPERLMPRVHSRLGIRCTPTGRCISGPCPVLTQPRPGVAAV